MALTLHGTVSDNTVALDRKSATPIIINGDMIIAQRGNLTGVSSGDNYVTDNFFTTPNSLGTFSISQDTDTPTGQGFRKSLKLDCTTAGSVDGAGDYIAFQKRIESQDLQLLKKGTSSAEYVTIAFWVKSTVTGTATLEIEDENSRTISQTYTISSSNTWEKKVLSFIGDTSGALGNDNAKGITLIWWLGAGTTFTSGTLNTSWSAQNNANRVSSSNINIASSTDNNFYITGVQLEVGQFDSNSIPNFQFEDVGTNLNRCRRYCYVVGGTGDGGAQCVGDYGVAIGSTVCETYVPLQPEMRAAPSMTNSGSLNVSNGSTAQAATAIAINSTVNSRQFAGVRATVASGLSAGTINRIEDVSSGGAKIILDAEL